MAVRQQGGTGAQIWAAMRQQAVKEGNANAVRSFDGLEQIGPDKIPMVVNGQLNSGGNISGFGGIPAPSRATAPDSAMYWYRIPALSGADGDSPE